MEMSDLRTQRLRFRQLSEEDYPDLKRFFSSPENTRFVGGLKDPEEAWRLMAVYIGHYHLKGYSYLALEDLESGKFAGCLGIWNSESWPEPELGYWLLPESQGQGYGSEAAMAAKRYAFETLKMDTLVSYIDKENTPSRRLAEGIGGKLDGSIQLLDFGEHLVYRYSA